MAVSARLDTASTFLGTRHGRASSHSTGSRGLSRIARCTSERYRRMMELDIRTAPPHIDLGDPSTEQSLLVGNWAGRYSRRTQTLDGSYGAPADRIGQAALMARNRAIDERTTGVPAWDADARERFSWIYSNPTLHLGASAPEDPHPYGASAGFCSTLALAARPRAHAWLCLRTWAYHRPAAWAEEDRRRKRAWLTTRLNSAPAAWTRALTRVDGRGWRPA